MRTVFAIARHQAARIRDDATVELVTFRVHS